MSETSLPSAPNLEGEKIILNVFTHPSLRQEGRCDDYERYAALGEEVFRAAITHAIFLQYPNYRTLEIAEEREKQLSDQNYEHWNAGYRLRERLRFHPSASEEIFSAKGAREMFHAYVGGIYTQINGPILIKNWTYNLIAPPEARVALSPEVQQQFHSPPPPSGPYPMPPPPPPAPVYPTPGHPSIPRSRTSSFSSGRRSMGYEDNNASATTTTGKIIFLPRFNEICMQRRLDVQYTAEQGGLQHVPRWLVTCIVDGVQRGQGSATTKQLAKEEAAKQAWISFGWGMP